MGRPGKTMAMNVNMTLLTDLYQLTMVGGYFLLGKSQERANFDYFFRKIPESGGFCVAAGLEQLIDYIQNIHFEPEDIEYLQTLNLFSPEVLKFFQELRFTGDLYAVPEGTLVFPHEPIIRVTAPLPEAQFIETALLNYPQLSNPHRHQGRPGLHRRRRGPGHRIRSAPGPRARRGLERVPGRLHRGSPGHVQPHGRTGLRDSGPGYFGPQLGGIFSHRAGILSGLQQNLSGEYAPPGRHLRHPAQRGPQRDQGGQGAAAERAGDLAGIRLDSGDLTFLSREARRLLDEAGFERTRILGSSDLDEWLIESIKKQGAEIDIWGVGTRLVTSYSWPALGGVYKLSAIFENGRMQPKLKVSDDPEKTTNPGVKKVVRFFDERNLMRGDVMFFEDEIIPDGAPVQVFHPMLSHVHKTYPVHFRREEILVPVFKAGKLVYPRPPLQEIQERTLRNLQAHLRPEHKRLQNPHIYHVSLGEKLFRRKQELIESAVGNGRAK